jgi:hypothetical protein
VHLFVSTIASWVVAIPNTIGRTTMHSESCLDSVSLHLLTVKLTLRAKLRRVLRPTAIHARIRYKSHGRILRFARDETEWKLHRGAWRRLPRPEQAICDWTLVKPPSASDPKAQPRGTATTTMTLSCRQMQSGQGVLLLLLFVNLSTPRRQTFSSPPPAKQSYKPH